MLSALLILFSASADVTCTLRAPGGHCDAGLIPVKPALGAADVTLALAGGPVRVTCPNLGLRAWLIPEEASLGLVITDARDHVLAQRSGVPPVAVRAVSGVNADMSLACVTGEAERADVRLPERYLFAIETAVLPPTERAPLPPPGAARARWPFRAPGKKGPARPHLMPAPPAVRPEPAAPRRRVVPPPRWRARPVPLEPDPPSEVPAHDIY